MLLIHVLVLAGTTVLLALGGGGAALRLAGPSLGDRVLGLVVCSLTLAVVLLLVAGTGGILSPGPVAALDAGSAGALVVLVGPRRTWLWFTAVGTEAWSRLGHWRALVRIPWLCVLAVVAGIELVWHVAITFVLPPTGFDALEYHLTMIAWWTAHAGFSPPNVLNTRAAGYPATTELLFTHVALFVRKASVVDLGQLCFAVLGVLAVFGLARALGARRRYAFAAGLVFFLTPIVLAQSRVAYVDIATAVYFALCLYFLVRFLRSCSDGGPERPPAWGSALLSGLAAGLCIGSKVTGIPWMVAVGLVLAVTLGIFVRRGLLTSTRAATGVLLFAAPAVVLGCYWYVRDFVLYHNPFYPASLKVLGVVVFAGRNQIEKAPSALPFPVNVAWSWGHDLFPFILTPHILVDQRPGGLGPAFVYLLVPLSVVFVVREIRGRGRDSFALFVFAAGVLAWLFAPYGWWSRFTLQLVVVGAVLAALVLTRLATLPFAQTRPGRALAPLLVVASLLGAANASVGYDVHPSRNGYLSLPRVFRAATDPAFRAAIDAGGMLVADAAPAGSTVAVDPRNITYVFPVYGADFQRHVVAVDFTAPDLFARLRATGARYVFTAPPVVHSRPAVLPTTGLELVRAAGGYRLFLVTAH